MLKHKVLNTKIQLTDERFDRWILLWENTIDENFKGEKAALAKQKALLMRELMVLKMRKGE